MNKLSYMEIALVIAEILMGLVLVVGSISKSKKFMYPNEEKFKIKDEKKFIISQRILYISVGILYILIPLLFIFKVINLSILAITTIAAAFILHVFGLRINKKYIREIQHNNNNKTKKNKK